jgi:hypothetical protein
MEVKTCSVDGCNSVPTEDDKSIMDNGKCFGHNMIDISSDQLVARPRPMSPMHYTKKMYQDKRL